MIGDQCPGCGSMRGCACTPATIREQLVRDRAALSDRAAAYTARANDAARLLGLGRMYAGYAVNAGALANEVEQYQRDVETWLSGETDR